MDILVPEKLWSCSVMPEGTLERWRLPDGGSVMAGAPVAEVRIEDCLHEVLAPCDGRLQVLAKTNAVFEPGDAIGRVLPGAA